MKTIYTIDQGNSHPHIGFFVQEKLEKIIPLEKLNHPLDGHIVYSSVGDKNIIDSLFPKAIELRDYWQGNYFFDMPVHYDDALGEDRLYQGAYLFFTDPKRSHVLIDAGTFITIDFINSKGMQGGFILPGFDLLFKTYQSGNRLPKLSKNDFFIEEELPSSTKEAISAGVYHMIFDTLEKFINKQSPDLITITGGDGYLIKQLLKPSMTSYSTNDHLIHEALYFLARKHLLLQ